MSALITRTNIFLALIIVAVIAYYKLQIASIEAAQYQRDIIQQAQFKKTVEHVTEVSNDYYKQLQASLVREPDRITERVYVNAKCPVRTDTASSLDDGRDATRVELESRTVRSIEQVADKYEQLYKQCSYRLRAWQELNTIN